MSSEGSHQRSVRTQMAGNYKVFNEKLGKGAFATVYKGRCTTTNQDVAVKVIDLKKLSPDKVRYVKEEMRLMKGLKHPNVIDLLDTQQNERHILLIMELCTGGDLQNCIGRHRSGLSEPVAQSLFRQLIQGVDFLSGQGKMHRDLKTANLLLTSTDPAKAFLKIADFGLVKESGHESSSRPSMNDTICGTPLYMAPERMRQGYGFPSEMFSCGVILFEMLLGRVPFGGTTLEEIQAQCEKGFAEALPAEHGLSWTVVDLLEQLLRVDPVARPTPRQVLQHAWLNAPATPHVPPQRHVDAVPTPPECPRPITPTSEAQSLLEDPFASAVSTPTPLLPRQNRPTLADVRSEVTPSPLLPRADFDRWIEYAEEVLQVAREQHLHPAATALYMYALRCGLQASTVWSRLSGLQESERQEMHRKLLNIQRLSTSGFEIHTQRLKKNIEVEVAAPQQLLLTHVINIAQDGAVEESLCNAWSSDKSAITAHSLYCRACILMRGLVELDTQVPKCLRDKEVCSGFLQQLEKRCLATDLSKPVRHHGK